MLDLVLEYVHFVWGAHSSFAYPKQPPEVFLKGQVVHHDGVVLLLEPANELPPQGMRDNNLSAFLKVVHERARGSPRLREAGNDDFVTILNRLGRAAIARSISLFSDMRIGSLKRVG